jgi:NADPH:quinone reductase-like Zn-dependent oxidoreductase
LPASASGVGVAALQVAKALVRTSSAPRARPTSWPGCATWGSNRGLPTRAPDFAEAVLQATGGRGADLVVNAVGGSVFEECVRCMGFEGRLATVGYVDRVLAAAIDLQALHVKRLRLFGVSNKLRNADQRAAGIPAFRADLLPMIADGRIRPHIDRVFAFDELPAAQARMEDDRHLGKIVLQVAT